MGATMCICRRVRQRSAGARTPAIQAAIFERGTDSRIVLRTSWRWRNLSDGYVVEIKAVGGSRIAVDQLRIQVNARWTAADRVLPGQLNPSRIRHGRLICAYRDVVGTGAGVDLLDGEVRLIGTDLSAGQLDPRGDLISCQRQQKARKLNARSGAILRPARH